VRASAPSGRVRESGMGAVESMAQMKTLISVVAQWLAARLQLADTAQVATTAAP